MQLCLFQIFFDRALQCRRPEEVKNEIRIPICTARHNAGKLRRTGDCQVYDRRTQGAIYCGIANQEQEKVVEMKGKNVAMCSETADV